MTNDRRIGAGIDLGSNTFRLLIADCTSEKPVELCKKLATVGLGRGLQDTGVLREEGLQKGFQVLRDFRGLLDRYQAHHITVCGTEALRRAGNRHIFLKLAEKILQQPVRILTGEEEARLSLAGVLSGRERIFSAPLLLVDVGGGSTELIFAESRQGDINTISLSLGVVPLTEKFITGSEPDLAGLDGRLAGSLEPSLEKLGLLTLEQEYSIIGSGGTATSMAALHLGLSFYDQTLVHGHVLRSSAMEKLWSGLIDLPAAKRNELPCLGEGRGEILPAGIRLYYLLLKLLRQDRLQVSDRGLLEGILLSGLPREPLPR